LETKGGPGWVVARWFVGKVVSAGPGLGGGGWSCIVVPSALFADASVMKALPRLVTAPTTALIAVARFWAGEAVAAAALAAGAGCAGTMAGASGGACLAAGCPAGGAGTMAGGAMVAAALAPVA
jgi:hypothetical protein